jgi:hypothetical protein
MEIELSSPLELSIINRTTAIELQGVIMELSSPNNLTFPADAEMINPYRLWKISPESLPYKYGIFNSLTGWMIKRWDPIAQSIGICSGDTDAMIAWADRANLDYL